jgi:hypothetical protein
MSEPIILPIIHLNGTGPDTLREGYVAAMSACSAALDIAQKIEFNARDYYPSEDPLAWSKAREQFAGHLRAIKAAKEYFEAIAIHCDDAATQREERRNAK